MSACQECMQCCETCARTCPVTLGAPTCPRSGPAAEPAPPAAHYWPVPATPQPCNCDQAQAAAEQLLAAQARAGMALRWLTAVQAADALSSVHLEQAGVLLGRIVGATEAARIIQEAPPRAPVQAGQAGPSTVAIARAVPPHIAAEEAAACQCPCAGNCELALEGHLLAYDDLVEGIRAAQADVELAYQHLLAYDLDVDDTYHIGQARAALARCLGGRASELRPAPMPGGE